MKLSVAQLAEQIGISRQTLNSHVTSGALFRDVDKKIDTEHPKNAAWLENRRNSPPPLQVPHPRTGTGIPRTTFGNPIKETTRSPERQSTVPVDRRYRQQPTGDDTDSLENVDIDEVLAVMSTLDVRRFAKTDIEKLKSLEALLKTRVDRQHKRRELIERVLVQSVFAKLYQIDSSELAVLGARLAPAIAGVFGVDDAEMILKVEQMVDIETMKVKVHIKRLLHEFLVGQGAEGLE